MNKKRKYLCLLSKLIAEKIIKNQDDRLSNEVSIKVVNNDMQIKVVFQSQKLIKTLVFGYTSFSLLNV